MIRKDSSKTPKPKYRKINQGDPEIANRIRDFSERTRFPRYCIVDLMVKGALSPDLNSECDIHMRDFVLPVLLKNRVFLKATLSKIGGHDAQLRLVDSLREDTPFQDYIRARLLKLQQGKKALRTDTVIEDLRNCGKFVKLAKKMDDNRLGNLIKKIKNKIHLVKNRKKAKSGGHKKLKWLKDQLVIIQSNFINFGDDFDFKEAISTANRYNSRTIGERLNQLGVKHPFVVEEKKRVLKLASRNVLDYLLENLPADDIDNHYGAGTSARLHAYSEGRCTAQEVHKATLSQILYKIWWLKELFEDHPVDLGISESIVSSSCNEENLIEQRD